MRNTGKTFRVLLVLLLGWTALAATGQTPAMGGTWTATTPLPQGYMGHALVASNGFLYNLGGLGGQDGVLAAANVYYAPISKHGKYRGME